MEWKSSLVQAATYQQEAAILEVALHGGAVYRYFGVPAQTYEELLRAQSKGPYFNGHVRSRLAYTKIFPMEPNDSGPPPNLYERNGEPVAYSTAIATTAATATIVVKKGCG